MSTPFSPEATAAIQSLAGSMIREVADVGMGREGILPFWFGESDQPTPSFIREAAKASIDSGATFYSQNLGRPWLREEIARYLGHLHGKKFSADRIATINSGVTGLLLASELIMAPGDKVVAVTPLWPNITEIPRILRANVERVPLTIKEDAWHLDTQRLLDALTPDTRAVIINSPNNPTGWTIDQESISIILSHCRRHGIWILADDVYSRLVYDPSRQYAPSFLDQCEADDRVISVNSFSKAWRMTGWRAGWMVAPSGLMDEIAKLIEYNFSCMFEPTQQAAATALKEGEEEVAAFRQSLIHSRQLLSEGLSRLPGVHIPDAGGAMYLFFQIEGAQDSLALAKDLVQQVGLGLAPGAAFGPDGDGWLRWCHAVSDDARLYQGIERLERYLHKR